MHQVQFQVTTESTDHTQATLAKHEILCPKRNSTLVTMERGSCNSYRLMNQKAGTASDCWAKKPSGFGDKAHARPFSYQ